MDLGDGVLGKEGAWDVDLAEGKVKVMLKYDGAQVDADLIISLDAALLLDKLAEKIPGEIDDSIIKVLKVALGAAA